VHPFADVGAVHPVCHSEAPYLTCPAQ
jgi:hypothetical protein